MPNMEVAIYTFFIVIVIVVTAVAVKIAIRFDVNEWLKIREQKKLVKFQNMCPHVGMEFFGGKYIIRDLMQSPSGAVLWQCQRCQRISQTGTPQYAIKHWHDNPLELAKLQQDLQKQAKKIGYI